MHTALHRLLAKMYSCPAEWYRNANAAIAALFVIANGGALAIAMSRPTDPLSGFVVREATISLPIAAVAFALSVVAWFRPRLLPFALRLQTIGLVLLSGYVAFSATALFAPVPEGPGDFWVVGYFTLLLFYTAVSLVRFGLTGFSHANPAVFYAPVVVAAFAAVADVSIFLHALAS